MGFRGVISCVLLCALAVLNTNKAVEIEDSVLKQLLNTPAVLPTKNGYYVFVPSKNETNNNGNQNNGNQLAGPDSNQNSNPNGNQNNGNQLAGPNSNQNSNPNGNQNSSPNSNQGGANQNNLIIVVPPDSNQSPSNGNNNSDANKKPTPAADIQPNGNQNSSPTSNQGGANQNNLIIVVPPGSNQSPNNQNDNSDANKKPTAASDSQPAANNENNKPADANNDQKPASNDNNANADQKPADSDNGAESKNNESPDNSDDNKNADSDNKPADSDDGKKSDAADQKPEDSDQNSKGNEEPPVPECCKAKGKKASEQTATASQEPAKPASDVKPLIPQARGVNRGSAEMQCIQNKGFFDGPTDQASVDAMKKYNIDIVRIPLNQDCWLALNEFSWGEYFGENYRKAINDYVRLLRSNGIKVILDLHLSDGAYEGGDCKDFSAKCQKPMPDSYNSPNFWKSVANQFKDDDTIIFDLFNNPYPDQVLQDYDLAWKCWRDGGNDCFSGIHYNVAGMQDLVNAVRETGATNHLMIGGLRYANDLFKWEQWAPKDPQNKIIISWHTWDSSKCNTEECWDQQVAPLAKKYPMIVGEIGEVGCTHAYTDKIMSWLNKQGIGYLAWSWEAGDCNNDIALLSDYDGTPNEYGKGILKFTANRDTIDGSPATNSASADNSGDASDDSCVCPPDSADKKPEEKPAEEKKPEEKPAEEKKPEEKPAEEKKPEEKPAEEKKPEEKPAEEKKPEEKPAEEKKPEEKPAEEKKPEEEPKKKSLKGVNRSSFEYSCVQNLGISEGPLDDAAIQVMKTWNIDIVRVPLNEDCWLGIGGHNRNYIGDKYRKAVEEYVRRLRSNGLKVIVDLHWTDGLYGGPGQGSCYDVAAKCQKPMPDMSHSPRFWKSVATLFKDDEGIIFDIFNEPFPDMVISDKTQAWKCLRDGGKECPGFQFEVAGMQDLVNAVRKTGAKNQIMSPGITWTNDLSRWLEFAPKDPANNLAASWHSYDFNACNNQGCWDSQIAPVAAKYPVIVGEIGEHGCSHGYVDKLMPWLDSKNINYIAWTWNTWDCSSGPALISDYNGTPTNFGVGIRDHFKKNVKQLN